MSTGGLTGTGGGSIAGTAPPPPARQPDGASLISYAQASTPKPEGAKREGGGKTGTDAKAGGDGWAQSEEQSQKLQDFDAVKGRPNLGDDRQGGGQKGEREGGFAGCVAGAAKDVVVGTLKGAYETVRDAGGAVLDQAGVDGFEGHTERTAERVDAVKDGVKTTVGVAKDAGGAVLDQAGAGGFEGHTERTVARGEAVMDAVVEEGAEIMAEIDNGDSCALGERVGTTVGVGAMVVIPGGALVKGGKVLAKMGGKDGPEAKPDAQDAGKTEKAEGGDASAGVVKGTYSNRDFNPEKAGGPILDLDYRDADITKEGIKDVETHLGRFEDYQPNDAMVERLHKIADGEIEATDYDRKFFTHERRELERYRALDIPDDVDPGYDIWNDTHTATLEDYKIADKTPDGQRTLYHPDAGAD